MSWKLVLLVATAAGLAQAQSACPSVPVPSNAADTNFIFQTDDSGWDWTSSTTPGCSISDSGEVTWPDNEGGGNLRTGPTLPVNTICIEWSAGGYNCVGRPNQGLSCSLPSVNGIENVWGFK